MMSAPDIISNIVRGWNRDPAGTAFGTARSGISAALWTHCTAELQEVTAEPDPTKHILASMISSFWAETYFDGRLSYRGCHRPGMVNLVRTGAYPRAVLKGPFKVLHVYVPDSLVRRLLIDTDMLPDAVELIDPACGVDRTLERIGREIFLEMHEKRPLAQLRIDALGVDLTVQLLRRWSSLVGKTSLARMSSTGGLAGWQERRVTEYLQEHLADDVALCELADIARLSTFHFARAFKRSTGLTPHAYLRRLRADKARDLLSSSERPIGEIAADVGYETPQAFARMFRAEVGASPSEFRRQRWS